MKNLDFEWLTDEFMVYCRSTQLWERTMYYSYEQILRLFERCCTDELKIYSVAKITEERRKIQTRILRLLFFYCLYEFTHGVHFENDGLFR